MSVAAPASRERVLLVLLTAIFASMICVTIINVALPSLRSGLGADDRDLQWVLASYALTYGLLLIPAGRAGDLFGTRAYSASASASSPSPHCSRR